jgi:hypothetical protein
VVVGTTGVLTARHVVGDALAAKNGRVLCRVVRAGSVTTRWVAMRVVWDAPEWDIALIAVNENAEGAERWLAPVSPDVVVVALGSVSEPGCEAVGFPQAAVQQGPTPDERVRQTEQVRGPVLPLGQGKRPVDPERDLPERWMPLDVETATPGTQAGWGGMSGAGVLLPDGRLIGLVVDAEAEHQQRRLYLVPLAAVLERAEGFTAALSGLTGRREVAEARQAPSYRAVLRPDSLTADGLPRPLGEVEELSVFGVKPADLPGESTYLDYVPRDGDAALREGLQDAIATRRMLLVVGASASGKSRSASRIAAELLPERRLVAPRPGSLAETIDLLATTRESALVWLDDAEQYADTGLRDSLDSLAQKAAVVIGTIRRAELDALTASADVRNPAGEALTDPKFVVRLDWKLAWSDEERSRLLERVKYPGLLEAVEHGTPAGVYCVAGPALVGKLNDARTDDEYPARYALLRTVLDWFRTGVGQPIPLALAVELTARVAAGEAPLESDEIEEALEWTTKGVQGFAIAHRTRQALLTVDHGAGLIRVHDYLRDEDQRTHHEVPSDPIWAAALENAEPAGRWTIGTSASHAGKTDIALEAMTSFAQAGYTDAMSNLGVLLEKSDPEAATSWYEKAAKEGHIGAMNNLGQTLEESDPEAARRWYEQAAEAGDTLAMFHLGVMLMRSDRGAAMRWFERAADGGDTNAMFNLGRLLLEDDPEQAERRWREAAEAGNTRAMVGLTLRLAERDPETARGWYQRTAEIGDLRSRDFDLGGNALFTLGQLLEESDPEAAIDWYKKAMEAVAARPALGRSFRSAKRHFLALIEARRKNAMFNLASQLVEDDPEAGRFWFENAAEAGHAGAMFYLGTLLRVRDPTAAQLWWEKSAAAGNHDAMMSLGELLAESDPDAARRWRELAAETLGGLES